MNGRLYIFDKVSRKDPMLMFWKFDSKNECKGGIHTMNNETVKVWMDIVTMCFSSGRRSCCHKSKSKTPSQRKHEVTWTAVNGCIENCSRVQTHHFCEAIKKSREGNETKERVCDRRGHVQHDVMMTSYCRLRSLGVPACCFSSLESASLMLPMWKSWWSLMNA